MHDFQTEWIIFVMTIIFYIGTQLDHAQLSAVHILAVLMLFYEINA